MDWHHLENLSHLEAESRLVDGALAFCKLVRTASPRFLADSRLVCQASWRPCQMCNLYFPEFGREIWPWAWDSMSCLTGRHNGDPLSKAIRSGIHDCWRQSGATSRTLAFKILKWERRKCIQEYWGAFVCQSFYPYGPYWAHHRIPQGTVCVFLCDKNIYFGLPETKPDVLYQCWVKLPFSWPGTPLDKRSAATLSSPSKCTALRDTPRACAHNSRSWAFLCRDIERTPPWWFMYDTTVVLSERTIIWFSWSWGRKWIKARNTASSSKRFMCSPIHEASPFPCTGLPRQTAPQPACEASVVTVSLEHNGPSLTPSFRPGVVSHHLTAGRQSRSLGISRCPFSYGLTLYFANHRCNGAYEATPMAAAIRPSSLQPNLTVTCSFLRNSDRHSFNTDCLCGVRDALIIIKFKFKLRYVTTLLGVRQLFLLFRVNPNLCKWARTTVVLLLACCSLGVQITQSSR